MKYLLSTLALLVSLVVSPLFATESLVVTLYNVNEQGNGKQAGIVTIIETPYGLLFQPLLSGLTPGIHGFHIHEKPDCGPAEKDGKRIPAGAAGSHYDPDNSNAHGGPYGKGHRGDLPGLVVNQNGVADYSLLAPRLKTLNEIAGHSLMIHVGGDNYVDVPVALGGGGARMLCGVIR